MTEGEISQEELEAFREELREAIESNVFIIVSGQDEGPFTVDPFSLGLSEETLDDLPPNKAGIIKDELYKLLDRTDNTQPVLTYEVGEEDKLSVSVFEGRQNDEEGNEKTYYLHEIKHPDGNLDWQLSATTNPLL